MAVEHAGHRQRMRERFIQTNLAGFAPHEVLEVLLFYAIPQRDVNPLAHRLLDHFGSLYGVMTASVEELAAVEGMGQYAASLIHLVHEMQRYVELNQEDMREVMKNYRDALQHCLRLLSGEKNEKLYAVCMNTQMEILSDVLLSQGTVGEVPVYSRMVAQAVLRHNARCVVLCHNHPGGSLFPSPADLQVTRTLGEMLQSMEIVLVDHVIVANNQAISMKAADLFESDYSDKGVTFHAAEMDSLLIRRQVEECIKKGKICVSKSTP